MKYLWVLLAGCLSCQRLYSDALDDVSLDDKIAQLMIVAFEGDSLNESVIELISDIKVGGVIYYSWANGLTSSLSLRKLSSDLQKIAPWPLLITIDQEGGLVSRLKDDFTIWPGLRALGDLNNTDFTKKAAMMMASELVYAGVNLNFAPVVDICSHIDRPVMGIRCFGTASSHVVTHASSMMEGFSSMGLGSTLKHFPGHGQCDKDSHSELPILDKTLEELEECELSVYDALASHATAVMTAHILAKAFDDHLPCTLSHKALSYLREKLRFEGLIISDSLVMGALSKAGFSLEEAAIGALMAGCDMILLGGRMLQDHSHQTVLGKEEIRKLHQAIKTSVLLNKLPKERIEEAFTRVMALKKSLPQGQGLEPDFLAHKKWASIFAQGAIKQYRLPNRVIKPLSSEFTVIAPSCLKNELLQTPFKGHKIVYFEEIEPLGSCHFEGDVVVFSYDTHKNQLEKEQILSLLELYPEARLVMSKNPEDLRFFKNAHVIYTTSCPLFPSLAELYMEIIKP